VGDGPIYAVWELTLRCDLACGHCGSRAGRPRERELSTAEALDLVAQMAGVGVTEVTLIGGEAYLRDDWTEIARAIRKAGMRCTVTTGGRGLTAERARAAADAGVQSVSVSLDGMEAAHDRQRGLAGSFRAALAAIAHLREAGIPVAANSQINRLSFPDFDSLLDLLISKGAHAWQVQLTVAMGRAADRFDWLLQPYELLRVIPHLAQLAERARDNGVRFWPGNNVGYFGPYAESLMGSQATAYRGCGAGASVLGIEADGGIKGCPSLPSADYVGGNVRVDSLANLLRQSTPLRFTRDRTIDELWGYCRDCYYADECRAGCTWTGHVLFGRRGNNPYCHHRALELAQIGKRERLAPIAPAPGQPFDHGLFEIILEEADDDLRTLPATDQRQRKRLPLLQ